jgi:hypothetical protein
MGAGIINSAVRLANATTTKKPDSLCYRAFCAEFRSPLYPNLLENIDLPRARKLIVKSARV